MRMKLTPVRTTTGAAAIAVVLTILRQCGIEIGADLQGVIIVIGSALLGRLVKPAQDPGDGA